MMRPPPLPPYERLLWEGHPSWADHALLFAFMGFALARAAVAAHSADWLTAALYLLAIGVFFGIAAAFHYGTYYQISSQRIRIATGLRKPTVRDIPIEAIAAVAVRHELLNPWFGLGALALTLRGDASAVLLKGIPTPDRLKRQIEFLAGLRPAYEGVAAAGIQ
ncbi:PH domain-containing protein [Nitrospira sp. Kam-Ns4a]